MSNWMESLKLLLDDFEKGVGADAIAPEYHTTKAETMKKLESPTDTAKLDEEMEAARAEIAKIRSEARTETQERQARLSVLRERRAKTSMELASAKRDLEQAKEPVESGGLMSRIFGRRKPNTAPMEKEVERLQKELAEIEAKVGAEESGAAEKERAKSLEAAEAKLEELGEKRDSLMQMADLRLEATAALSESVKKTALPAAQV